MKKKKKNGRNQQIFSRNTRKPRKDNQTGEADISRLEEGNRGNKKHKLREFWKWKIWVNAWELQRQA